MLTSLTGKRRMLRLPDEKLPWTVLAITCLSVIAYAGYPIDDYLWHTSYGAATWTTENTLLICACAAFFLSGLGVRGFLILMSFVALFSGVSIIGASDLSQAPVAYSGGNSEDWGVYNLLVLMIPLLLAMTFAFAAAVA